MPENAPYFKWFPKDCDSDENVRAMDDREFGFYVRLLNHSWLNEGVPADMKRLAVIMGRTPSYLAKVWPAISPCFFEVDGRLFNKKQENLREILQNLSEKKSGAASTRWAKYKKTQERDNAPASSVQCYPEPEPDPKPEKKSVAVISSTPNGKNGHALCPDGKPRFEEPPKESQEIPSAAGRMYGKHPKAGSRGLVEFALIQAIARGHTLAEIETRHDVWVRSDDWRGTNKNWVPALPRWLDDDGFTKTPTRMPESKAMFL